MKKYSWIVALLIALTFATIFIACGVDPLDPETEEEEFEEVELSNFNAWGGNRTSQMGWGTDGLVFLDDGDGGNKMYAVKNIGVTVEQWQAAKFLQFDVNESKLSASGTDLIWAGTPDQGWNQANGITTGAGGTAVGVTRDGGTIKIDLARAMNNYGKFKSFTPKEAGDGLRIIIQYGSLDHKDLGITNAKLLIPATPPPFEAIEELVFTSKVAFENERTQLGASISPVTATNQGIIWAIDTTASGDISWGETDDAYWAPIDEKIEQVWNQEWPDLELVDGVVVLAPATFSRDTILAKDSGKLTFRAIIQDGLAVTAADVGKDLQSPPTGATAKHASTFEGSDETTGKEGFVTEADVGKTYDFVSLPLVVNVYPGPQMNANVGGTNQVISLLGGNIYGNADQSSWGNRIEPAGATIADGLKIVAAANYGFWAYFMVDLGAGKTAADIDELTLYVEPLGGDCNFKQLSITASDTKPTARPPDVGSGNNLTQDYTEAVLTTADNLDVSGSTAQQVYFSIRVHCEDSIRLLFKGVKITFQ